MPKKEMDNVNEILDALAETWVEKNGIEQQIRYIPTNFHTDEYRERTYELILRFVKQAYVEGLFTGSRKSK